MGYEKFVDDFSQYFSSFELTKDKIRLLKLAMNEVKDFALPSRDGRNTGTGMLFSIMKRSPCPRVFLELF